MPVEVMHVGAAEAFSPSAARQFTRYGRVALVDLLTRLAPELRGAAAGMLRSFAVKPFAMLASSFDEESQPAAQPRAHWQTPNKSRSALPPSSVDVPSLPRRYPHAARVFHCELLETFSLEG
eukprot:scaffold3426_cov67-Isochrysis_galbana.AAC.1